MTLTVSKAADLLRSMDHVLILTHVRPDGDTVGCAAALCPTFSPTPPLPILRRSM